MKIGFFDSGIGGITVLYEALKILPNEDYIYYADTTNVPYGVKPKDDVRKYIFDAVDFIVKKGVQAVVIACNTATSVAIEGLRSIYKIPIIGMEPAVKPAVEKNSSTDKRVLVTATQLTLKEEKLKNLISRVDNEHIVDLLPLPGLVEFAESLVFDESMVLPYLEQQFSALSLGDYGTVVLGCTHFPFYKDSFRKLLPEGVDIIDGSCGTVRNLKRIMQDRGYSSGVKGSIEYYSSGVRAEENSCLKRYERLLDRLRELDR